MAINQVKFQELIQKYGSPEAVAKAFSNKYGDNSTELKQIQDYIKSRGADQTKDYWSKNPNYPTSGNDPKFSDPSHQAFFEGLSPADKKRFYTDFQSAIKTQGMGDPNKTFNEVSGSFISDRTSDYMNSFEKGFGDYTKANLGAYDIQTQRDLETKRQQQQDLQRDYGNAITNLDWQKQKSDLDLARTREDYAKYTSQNQQDFNRSIAQGNKDMAIKLSQASSAYGKRGLMRSGVQNSQTMDATQGYVEDVNYFKTLNQRKLDEASQNLSRAEQDYNTQQGQIGTLKQRATDQYNTGAGRIGTDILNYQSDRSAGAKSLEYQLQAQGDTLYNNTMAQLAESKRKQAENDAINQMYGIKSTPTRVPYRSAGQYIY